MVTKYKTIYLHLERNLLSVLRDHRAFVYSTSPTPPPPSFLLKPPHWHAYRGCTTSKAPSAAQQSTEAGLVLAVCFHPWPIFPLPPLLHYLGDIEGATLFTAFKLFLYQEQYILKHYMHPRFVSMWSIYFNLGLSVGGKK